MNVQINQQSQLAEFTVNIRLKLAGLWTSLMFLYIYVDYFHLYMPGSLADLSAGKVFTFQISQTFLLVTMVFMAIPALMIYLSIALPAKVDRITNMLVATLFIPYTLFNLAGEAWIHMYFAAGVEVMLLLLIIRYASKWPRVET
jgi:hypothetical protein